MVSLRMRLQRPGLRQAASQAAPRVRPRARPAVVRRARAGVADDGRKLSPPTTLAQGCPARAHRLHLRCRRRCRARPSAAMVFLPKPDLLSAMSGWRDLRVGLVRYVRQTKPLMVRGCGALGPFSSRVNAPALIRSQRISSRLALPLPRKPRFIGETRSVAQHAPALKGRGAGGISVPVAGFSVLPKVPAVVRRRPGPLDLLWAGRNKTERRGKDPYTNSIFRKITEHANHQQYSAKVVNKYPKCLFMERFIYLPAIFSGGMAIRLNTFKRAPSLSGRSNVISSQKFTEENMFLKRDENGKGTLHAWDCAQFPVQ